MNKAGAQQSAIPYFSAVQGVLLCLYRRFFFFIVFSFKCKNSLWCTVLIKTPAHIVFFVSLPSSSPLMPVHSSQYATVLLPSINTHQLSREAAMLLSLHIPANVP